MIWFTDCGSFKIGHKFFDPPCIDWRGLHPLSLDLESLCDCLNQWSKTPRTALMFSWDTCADNLATRLWGSQWRHIERSYEGIPTALLRSQIITSAARHVSERGFTCFQPPALSHPQDLSISGCGPRHYGAETSHPTVSSLNSWPATSVSMIKWLFYVTKFRVVCCTEIDNWNSPLVED